MEALNAHVRCLEETGVQVLDVRRSNSVIGKFYLDAVFEGDSLVLKFEDPQHDVLQVMQGHINTSTTNRQQQEVTTGSKQLLNTKRQQQEATTGSSKRQQLLNTLGGENFKSPLQGNNTGQSVMTSTSVMNGDSHYAIQPAEYAEKNKLSFLEGCVIEKVTRHRHQDGKGCEDIRKAIHQLEMLLSLSYGK